MHVCMHAWFQSLQGGSLYPVGSVVGKCTCVVLGSIRAALSAVLALELLALVDFRAELARLRLQVCYGVDQRTLG